MKRRTFIKLCTSVTAAIAANPRLLAAAPTGVTARNRVKLVDAKGAPVHPDGLAVGQNYIFHYPFQGTPCFLLRLPAGKVKAGIPLKTEKGEVYPWAGGVGKGGTVVAFSAICTHLMTHPTDKLAFIHYYHGKDSELAGRSDVITCCAHGSVFDPAAGAKVIAGPAPQPLTAIVLELDAKDGGLYAVGTQGADIYHQFFRAFKRELRKQFGRRVAKREVEGTTTLVPLEEYTKQRIDC